MQEMIINYKNIDILQDDYTVLKNVNFQVTENQFIFLTGIVGSGKSTFLKSLYASTTLKGETADVLGIDLLTIKPKNTPLLRKQLGIVFQDFQLLSDRTVYANLEFVLKATGWKKKEEIDEKIKTVLETVSLESKADKYPHELSGGEQQRVSIARAILNTPKIIIADEPTGNLDPDASRQIVNILQNICSKGTTIIMSTHNMALIDLVPNALQYTCTDQHIINSNCV